MPQGLKILWLKSGPLHPLDTGGKIRTYNMLRELKKNHELTFLALCPHETNEFAKENAAEFSHRQIWVPWKQTRKQSIRFVLELASNFFLSRQPYIIQKYLSDEMRSRIQALDSTQQFDLIICDFLTPAVNLFVGTGKLKTPVLLFQHNVESLIWERLSKNATGAIHRAYFKSQWERMKSFERAMCLQFDSIIGVSDDDCHILQTQFGLANVLGSVPTGVDFSFFNLSHKPRKPHSLVFLGSMDWMPNIDACSHFVESIFPAIKKRFPDATLTIVGRNPTQRIKDLQKNETGIVITGTVKDVRPHLAEAEVMIVPLRIGGGTRVKIYEGMATGIPIVSSTIGAEGLSVTHGKDILLADSPEDFSNVVSQLFENAPMRHRIGENGRALVQRRFSWETVTKVFERYCYETCARRGGPVTQRH